MFHFTHLFTLVNPHSVLVIFCLLVVGLFRLGKCRKSPRDLSSDPEEDEGIPNEKEDTEVPSD